MSRENSVQLIPYHDRGQSFLPAIPGGKMEFLEGRLSNQEKTTTILLEQAFKIKEDVSLLRGNRGTQWDLMAQRLLENHMQIVTQIVKQLSKDIEVLENEIRTRDTVSTGTSFAVQHLDRKHLTGFGDLRGRVARFLTPPRLRLCKCNQHLVVTNRLCGLEQHSPYLFPENVLYKSFRIEKAGRMSSEKSSRKIQQVQLP